MAISGLIMVLFLLAHMYGNLKAFSGRAAFDDYAHHLRTVGEPFLPYAGALWMVRVVLVVSVVIHIGAALIAVETRAHGDRGARQLALREHPGPRRCPTQLRVVHDALGRGDGRRLFIVYHLLHLSTNTIHPGGASPSPYVRLVNGFQIWWVVASYTIALIAVGFHLRHGFWSAFATLGANTSVRRRRHLNVAAVVVAVVITVGFLIVPFSVLFGWVGPVSSSQTERVRRLLHGGGSVVDEKAPPGPIEERWDTRKFHARLISPANRRELSVIIVGTGLAGASAAATLGEAGYRVTSFCYQDSPRRAHSIAAQGGINAAKNYRNDGDSIYRLFYDTVKGGDFRSRESNVYRLAQVSGSIIDQCVAQGVPFAREYGGLLDTRSFGGVQVSRTFYARGQTGQQLLLGAYQALERQVKAGTVDVHSRHEMLDLIVADGRARGVIVRDMTTGEIETHFADAVVLATGGYGNAYFLSTNAMGCNVTATWRAHRRGALFANPCFTQIHPTCIPVSGEHQSKLTLMSESLRNDGRIWVPAKRGDDRHPGEIPESERDYYLERTLPGVRQPGPARRRLARGQERVRRGPRRRPRRARCLPGLRRRLGAAGPAGDRRPVRQPLRDVPADHWRRPVPQADADLPRRALHDGRTVGRLRPAGHHCGPVRDR